MDRRLRPRNREVFTGFTTPEIEKMEKLLKESREKSLDIAFFKKLTRSFNCSSGRAGKPYLKWTEVQSWYENRQIESLSKDNLLDGGSCPVNKPNESIPASKGEMETDASKLEFEARSSSVGAWVLERTSLPMERRLRPKQREIFTGFTTAEIEKMKKLLKESSGKCLDVAFFKKLTRSFNCSSGRAGKPYIKWTEVQSWYQNRQLDSPSKDNSLESSNKSNPGACPVDKPNESILTSKGEMAPDVSKLQFEARSSMDGAWYDVEKFITCRNLGSGETEALVRYVGFDSDYDEWVNVKESIRERSLVLDHSECHLLKVGDLVLCFQEREDVARHYDAHVVDIQRRLHDIRGCRCTFLIRYNHSNIEERVDLTRLCRRPT